MSKIEFEDSCWTITRTSKDKLTLTSKKDGKVAVYVRSGDKIIKSRNMDFHVPAFINFTMCSKLKEEL
jgi:hypothetical protein